MTVTNPYKNIGDKFKVCARQEQSFRTYITFRSYEVSLDHDDTWVDIVDKLNCILQKLMDLDHAVVVYPFPKNFITPPTDVKTYSRLNIKNKQNRTKWVDKHNLEPYVDRVPGLNIGKPAYIKQSIGYKYPFEDFMTESIKKSIKLHRCSLFKTNVQAAAETTAAWFCGAYERTFDTKEYSQLCQNLQVTVKNPDGSTSRKAYFDYPVAVKKSILKLHPNKDILRWDHKDAVKVITLQTSAKPGAQEQTVQQVISLFNRDSHIEDHPNGYALTAFAWHGSSNIRPPTDIKEIAQKRAKAVHQHI